MNTPTIPTVPTIESENQITPNEEDIALFQNIYKEVHGSSITKDEAQIQGSLFLLLLQSFVPAVPEACLQQRDNSASMDIDNPNSSTSKA